MSSYLSKADGVVDARGRVVVTTLRLVCRLAVIAAFVGATLILPAATGAFAGPADTSLRASTSMEADLRASFGWMLSKTASPTSLSLATGESGTVDYTVGATKGTAVLSTTLEGDICVTNTGAVPTQGLSISVRITKPPEKAVLASTDVSVAGHPVLSPGETHCYAYSVDLSDGVVPGATYKSTATVSIENKSGRGGPAEPSATVTLPTTPSTVDNESITVVDTNGSNWLFSEFGAETYSQEFTCDQDGGTHTNTVATAGFISTQATPTPQAQSATVTVVCPSPGLSVTKEADDESVSASQEVGFTVTVANSGTGDAHDVFIFDLLPDSPGLNWQIEDESGHACVIEDHDLDGEIPPQLNCNLGTLIPGASYVVHIVSGTFVDWCGLVSNTATVFSSNAPEMSATDSIAVECPDLSFTKSADAETVAAGAQIGFTVSVANSIAAGTGAAFDVGIFDPLPEATGLDWSIESQTSDNCQITGSPPSVVLSCHIDSMSPGATYAVHVVSTTTTATCGLLSNRAQMFVGTSGAVASDSTTVECPDSR